MLICVIAGRSSCNGNTYQRNNAGTLDINQTRAHNASNQITGIDSVSTGVSYDNNGNMLNVPTNGQELDGPSRKLVWDAWSRADWREARQITQRVTRRVSRPWGGLRINRLRKVLDENDNVIAEYQYDGLMRRTTSTVSGTVRHFYYDDQWRSIEERLGTATTPERQHVWQPGDRWNLILRDRSTANNGVLDERLYSLKDELDPVALSDTSGNVVERYAYSAFGKASFFDASYTARTSSSYEWNFLFHGEFADTETGWMNYGFRYYSVDLGRWLNEDPLDQDVFLYLFVTNDPANSLDYLGLWGWRDIAGFVPDLGSTLDAIDSFKEGNIGMGILHAGLALTDLTGGGLLLKGATKGFTKAFPKIGFEKAGREFSHSLPARYFNKPDEYFPTGGEGIKGFAKDLMNKFLKSPAGKRLKDSRLNGNMVSEQRHYKHDPKRFPTGWQDMGPRFPKAIGMADRVPDVIKGGAILAPLILLV